MGLVKGQDGRHLMVDRTPDGATVPPPGPNMAPDTRLLDRQIGAALDARGVGKGGGGGHIGDMTNNDGRLNKLENEVHAIKGALDWAKITFTILVAVVLAGFGISITLNLNMSSKVSGLFDKLTEEFRAQRLQQTNEVSAISNAITATKQQPAQIIIWPTSAPSPTISPAPVTPSPTSAPK